LYIPSQTKEGSETGSVSYYKDYLRKQFALHRHLPPGEEKTRLLSQAFSICRQLNDTFQTANKAIPWLGGVPEPKFNDEPLVKLVSNSTPISVGMLLIAHPLLTDPRESRRSVWMITGMAKGTVHVSALSGEWSRVGHKKGVLTTNPDAHIQGRVYDVGEGLYYGEVTPNVLYSPSECRPVNTVVWNLSDLSEHIERGYYFLATCPISFLFPEQASNPEDPELSSGSRPTYDLSVHLNDDLWKKLLQSMGGECELAVYCFEKPPVVVEQESE